MEEGDLSTQSIIKAFSICPIPTRSSARDDGGGERPPSFRPKRSGVEKSHSPMVCSIATGDLSTQRFNSPEVFIPIPPCPSARDDGGGRQHTVISKGQMTETPPCPVVISTEAKWRNLTPQMAETLPPTRHFDESRAAKSHFPMVHAHGGRRPVITGP